MDKSNMWLPLIASIGVAAATFYTITKTSNPADKALETVSPILTDLTSTNSQSNYS